MLEHNIDAPIVAVKTTRYGPVEYAEFGKGPAVIALHGAMGGFDQSVLLARTIGDAGFRYIAVSRPGYLGTPLASGRTPQQQADLCAALLDVLDIPAALVMAVSGGGPCALQFALQHRRRCLGLVLVSTCGEKVDTEIPLSFHFMRFFAQFTVCANALRRNALANIERVAQRSVSDPTICARTLQDPQVGPLFKGLLTSTFERMPLRMPGTLNDIRISRSTDYPLEEIAVPVLIVHGTVDRMVPFEQHARALATRIHGSYLLAVEGGEHVAIFTHRQVVQPRVADFLRAHAVPTGSAVGTGAEYVPSSASVGESGEKSQ